LKADGHVPGLPGAKGIIAGPGGHDKLGAGRLDLPGQHASTGVAQGEAAVGGLAQRYPAEVQFNRIQLSYRRLSTCITLTTSQRQARRHEDHQPARPKA
jgi:hypothetical protein